MNEHLDRYGRLIAVEMAASSLVRAIDNEGFADFIGGVDKALDDLREAVKEYEDIRNDR